MLYIYVFKRLLFTYVLCQNSKKSFIKMKVIANIISFYKTFFVFITFYWRYPRSSCSLLAKGEEYQKLYKTFKLRS